MVDDFTLIENLLHERPQLRIDRRYFAAYIFRRADIFHDQCRPAQGCQQAGRQHPRCFDTSQGGQCQQQEQERKEGKKVHIQRAPFQTEAQNRAVIQTDRLVVQCLFQRAGHTHRRALPFFDGFLHFRPFQMIFHGLLVIVRFIQNMSRRANPGNAHIALFILTRLLQITERIIYLLDAGRHDRNGIVQLCHCLFLCRMPDDPAVNQNRHGHTGKAHSQQAEINTSFHTYSPFMT